MHGIRSVFVFCQPRKLYDWRQRWVLYWLGAKNRREMGTIYRKRRLASIHYAWAILPSDAAENREHLLVQVQSATTSGYFQICRWLYEVRTHVFRWTKWSFHHLVETRCIPSLLNSSIPILPIGTCVNRWFLYVYRIVPVLRLPRTTWKLEGREESGREAIMNASSI